MQPHSDVHLIKFDGPVAAGQPLANDQVCNLLQISPLSSVWFNRQTAALFLLAGPEPPTRKRWTGLVIRVLSVCAACGLIATLASGCQEQPRFDVPFRTDRFELTVTHPYEAESFDMPGFYSTPGTTYVEVRWEYKNATGKAVDPSDAPTLKLVDSKGTEYDAVMAWVDPAGDTDVNPGITIAAREVFQVQGGVGPWSVLVNDGQSAVEVSLNRAGFR